MTDDVCFFCKSTNDVRLCITGLTPYTYGNFIRPLCVLCRNSEPEVPLSLIESKGKY